MDDFLIKPVNFELLFDIIEKIKKQHKTNDPLTGKKKIDLITTKDVSSNSFIKALFDYAINELPLLIEDLRKSVKDTQLDKANTTLVRIKALALILRADNIKRIAEKIIILIKSNQLVDLNKTISQLVIDTLNLVNYISVQNSKLSE